MSGDDVALPNANKMAARSAAFDRFAGDRAARCLLARLSRDAVLRRTARRREEARRGVARRGTTRLSIPRSGLTARVILLRSALVSRRRAARTCVRRSTSKRDFHSSTSRFRPLSHARTNGVVAGLPTSFVAAATTDLAAGTGRLSADAIRGIRCRSTTQLGSAKLPAYNCAPSLTITLNTVQHCDISTLFTERTLNGGP